MSPAGKAAAAAAESAVASLDPGEMLQGGLKDDFRGKIIAATYDRWDYDGNIDTPVLAARLTIQPEDEDEPFTQHWSAGSLDSFVPSEDGKEETEEGPYALRVGKRAQLNNNTNFAHLMSAAIEAGTASKKFTRANLTAGLDCLVGIDAHWNRVPQKKRSGLVQAEAGEAEGGRKRSNDVLVITEVFGYREAAGKAGVGAKKVAAARPVPPKKAAVQVEEEVEEVEAAEVEAEEPEVDELDAAIQAALVEAIAESGNGGLKKAKVAPEVLKRMAGDKRKGAAVKRSVEPDFLKNGPWTYDAKAGTLTL